MTDIVVITSVRCGTAAHCLPALVAQDGVNVKAVILAHGAPQNRWSSKIRRVKKVCKIGLLGALNGVRIRSWFRAERPDVEKVCNKFNVPFFQVASINGEEAVRMITSLGPDLGVSLGNGWISPRIFTIPRLGTINLHSEILPAYQNAQSIIWPIYNADPFTGFTVHEMERQIDTGRILFQKKYPLRFFPSLEQTVRWNKVEVEKDIPVSVANVCAHIEEFKSHAVLQGRGGRYTTPSIWQFLRMTMNNRRFYKKQCEENGK